MADLEDVEIPASALAVKPWFPERPGDDVVNEIKAYIGNGGEPHLWRGHTHTKPSVGAHVVYREEVDIPGGAKGRRDRWAVCPCCHPTKRWWYKDGKIAWFPEEHVIRIIGPNCYATLNATGHAEANAELRREQERRKHTSFLLSRLGLVPDVVKAVEAAIPTARAIDAFRDDLESRLKNVLRTPLWQHVREGNLQVRVTRSEVRRRADGEENTVTVEDFSTYATISGYQI